MEIVEVCLFLGKKEFLVPKTNNLKPSKPNYDEKFTLWTCEPSSVLNLDSSFLIYLDATKNIHLGRDYSTLGGDRGYKVANCPVDKSIEYIGNLTERGIYSLTSLQVASLTPLHSDH